VVVADERALAASGGRAELERAVAAAGATLVTADLAEPGSAARHDPRRLADVLRGCVTGASAGQFRPADPKASASAADSGVFPATRAP
jgi:hypothetical protein